MGGILMVTDSQVRRYMSLRKEGKSQVFSCGKVGIDVKTGRRYEALGKLPSEVMSDHDWRTRIDPFEDVWNEVLSQLELNFGLHASTLFDWLQRRYPGRFCDGQIRTLQRRIKRWRATEGPSKEVFFSQKHAPGNLCASDFTHMNALGVTIAGSPFDHMIYHFVLTYSNWETFTICFSESFQSLSDGFQNALWKLGAVPAEHLTDRLTAAVNNLGDNVRFQSDYQSLLAHYGMNGRKTQGAKPNENGDIEQRNNRFKEAVDQSLMLRGSRDFRSLDEYERFLRGVEEQLNAGRRKRFDEELAVMKPLPGRRLESCRERRGVRVQSGSIIRIDDNVYSVNSRLIGEKVDVRIFADHLEVWYAQRKVEQMPRLRGHRKSRINYRHVIDSLVRKPGAFESYLYKDDLFPTSRFRMAYDSLKERYNGTGHKHYLKILHLAARENERSVDEILRHMIDHSLPIEFVAIKVLLEKRTALEPPTKVNVDPVDVSCYDRLLENKHEQ